MTRFFVNRPIVAIVISILLVLLGTVAVLRLPVAQFPDIAPPEILLSATYVGADAKTVEESVATPIEQQMSGVDNMLYMYSVNSGAGAMNLRVAFDVATDPNTDQILAQMRYLQAESQLPADVRTFGVQIRKATASPLVLFSLYSPDATLDATFLANYAYINLADPLARVPGVGQVQVFGAGQYAMRCWVNPDTLAKLGVTVAEIADAIGKQNAVNPAGQVGGEPAPAGQQMTLAVRAQGRLATAEEFGAIVVRAKPDGSVIRLRDVARLELGAQTYAIRGRYNGRPAAIVALYQLPGANALTAVRAAKRRMAEFAGQFPAGLAYAVSLDTTLAVSEGIREILKTLFQALALVILVVFLFLQNWRATLIPLLAVPVSLVGAFAVFPLLGFSVNTLSLFGLVLAIGLVVDDAIVVVEAVERQIEAGLAPRAATLKAMEQVAGPVVAIALILAAVFVPTAFIPGITGRLYQQFALTIAISVVISAFNALSLSPALAALLLRPRPPPTAGAARRGLAAFFAAFNRGFERATGGYLAGCTRLIRKALVAMLLLGGMLALTGWTGARLPGGFLPEEDQGYFFMNVQLPDAASLQRTDAVCRQIEAVLAETPGVAGYNTIAGYSMLSAVSTPYSAFYFVALAPWSERDRQGLTAAAIMRQLNRRLARLPAAVAFAFAPPAIPGVGTSGGVTFMLQDRAGRDLGFLAERTRAFLEAARRRPEFAALVTTLLPAVPQLYADVDRDKVLKQGVDLGGVYKTLQAFMGGAFVGYFNRFGRVWQVFVQAEDEFRDEAAKVGRFHVLNAQGQPVPLAALVTMTPTNGPEFTLRFNAYRAAQIIGTLAPGYSSRQGMRALEEVFAATMPAGMGYDFSGMSFQEKIAQTGVSPAAIFGLSLLVVFLILAAQYESWSLPFSVLLGTPVAVCGAFLALGARRLDNNVYAQIGLVMLIGLAAKNAILIVEFAKSERQQGRSPAEAALAAARLRLRPILMTAFAFMLGVIPLAIAEGAGASARRILGTAVLGGMLAASLVGIFFIPVCFTVVERLARRGGAPRPPAPAPGPEAPP